MKVTYSIAINGGAGYELRETIEFPDDTTDEDIEQDFQEWVWGQLDASWEKEDVNNGG